MIATDAKVLMVGPERSLQGGIVSVVDGYFEAGMAERCGCLDYQGTGVGTNLFTKSAAFAGSLASYLRRVGQYDIVHLHISRDGSYKRKSMMAKIARDRGKKVILHEHSGQFKLDFETRGEAYRDDVRKTFGAADKVVVVSEEWRGYFAENVCYASSVVVVHNGVKVSPEPSPVASNNDILFLGRLDENKSPDILIRAAAPLLDRHPDAVLLFAGDGNPEPYRNLALDLGIADKCQFLGWIDGDQKEALFSRAAINCLPSKHEAMPMSVLEAMAHGVPTICTAVGGVPQIIEDGVNGFLMGVDDIQQLTALLQALLSSPARRTEIGVAGRKKIAGDFGIETSEERIIEIYNELLEEARL